MHPALFAQTAVPARLDTPTIVAIAVGVVVVLLLIAFGVSRQRSLRLKQRFGSEYDRTVAQTGSASKAERELARREKRRDRLDIRTLTPGARTRYAEEWRTIQARFVDDPSAAVREADRVVNDVMRDRGYPVDDTAQRFDDLSVDHAAVIDNYRVARAIAARNARHEASTEDLRRATLSYRALFDDLLGDGGPAVSTTTTATSTPA